MLLKDLTISLDKFFNINSISKDLPFSNILPSLYDKCNYPWKKYFTPLFLKNFHGLMFDNNADVAMIAGTVFLDENVIDKILLQKEKNILIFTHHPMADETSGRGFKPLSEEYLEKLKKRKISVYSLHSPLDINTEISTTLSFLKACGLKKKERFVKEMGGSIGIIGEFDEPMEFESFINLLKKISKTKRINFKQNINHIRKVGIVPGGATDVSFIEDAINQGCDTYLAGEYYNKLQIKVGEEERKVFAEKLSQLNINMIEVSHYISERFVFQDGLKELFEKKFKLKYKFFEQDNPWY